MTCENAGVLYVGWLRRHSRRTPEGPRSKAHGPLV